MTVAVQPTAGLDELVSVAKALSDPGRVLALFALRRQELCVCQLTEFLGLAPSTVSKHLSLLRRARLVATRKTGRWVYYRRAADTPAARAGWQWFEAAAGQLPGLRAEAKRLAEITAIPVEERCRNRNG